jgi:hypothetical protein
MMDDTVHKLLSKEVSAPTAMTVTVTGTHGASSITVEAGEEKWAASAGHGVSGQCVLRLSGWLVLGRRSYIMHALCIRLLHNRVTAGRLLELLRV